MERKLDGETNDQTGRRRETQSEAKLITREETKKYMIKFLSLGERFFFSLVTKPKTKLKRLLV